MLLLHQSILPRFLVGALFGERVPISNSIPVATHTHNTTQLATARPLAPAPTLLRYRVDSLPPRTLIPFSRRLQILTVTVTADVVDLHQWHTILVHDRRQGDGHSIVVGFCLLLL